MSGEVSEAVIIVLAGTFLMLILVIFIISFFFIHQRRQTQHRLEKASLKAQYEAEILNAENEIQESTMKHISRELHDNVGQLLTLVKMQLNQMAGSEPNEKKLSATKEYVDTALTDIRQLSKSLNTDNILQDGLAKAIGFELQRIEKLGTISTDFKNTYFSEILDHKSEILVFRMVQEMLQNCLKHAQASNIEIQLSDNNDIFMLKIIDNGQGFDPIIMENTTGFGAGAGLKNLKHRANLLGGKLLIKSNNNGTEMLLSIPKK